MSAEGTAPRRHDLVRVAAADWEAALDAAPGFRGLPPEARDVIGAWAGRGWPAIVRRRLSGEAPGDLPLGVPLPPRLGKLRLALSLPEGVPWERVDGPGLAEAAAGAPPALAEAVDALVGLGEAVDVAPRPVGSLLWGSLTGLDYLGPHSDLDVLWPVVADTDLGTLLVSLRRIDGAGIVPVDGEVLLPDGAGIQWRELDRARRDPRGEVLAKALDGLSLRRVEALFPCLALTPVPHLLGTR